MSTNCITAVCIIAKYDLKYQLQHVRTVKYGTDKYDNVY